MTKEREENEMYQNYVIKEPFFEYGPKCYMYGDVLLNIAKGLVKLAKKYDVDVVLDVPDTEIYNIAKHTKRVHVYSQHMDSLPVGKGMGKTLPEAVKAAGAVGKALARRLGDEGLVQAAEKIK